MGSNCCTMTTDLPQPELMGCRKADIDKNTAKLVVLVKNLDKDRDKIDIIYPTEKTEKLRVLINDREICAKLLPGSIIQSGCNHKPIYGKSGKITVTLKKSEPGNWLDRWSPSREPEEQPALADA